ncbi:MAG: ribosome biosynthesis protein nip7 [Cercozoa sp. M6MM]
MRPLTDEESSTFFEKLIKYIGRNVKLLLNRSDEPYVFRLHKDRVYYLPERVLNEALRVSRDSLVSAGVCFGKFTKTRKFRLQITALPYLAKYAKYKVWIKPKAEMSYMYGNHVIKAALGRITENTPRNTGVVMFTMSDVPIGFGVSAYSTDECRKVEPTAIVCYHQADIGEYLRDEETLF